MTESLNLTPFLDRSFMTADKDGDPYLTTVLAATFDLPRSGENHLVPTANQSEIADQETWFGDPGIGPLRGDTQAVIGRPGTDIVLNGFARTPNAEPLAYLDTRLCVGALEQRVRVFGKRNWVNGLWGFRPSEPEPFHEFPLRYEYAFGGTCPVAVANSADDVFEVRNPIGMGFYTDKTAAYNQPLPHLEDPTQPITNHLDRPQPAGYGLIARSWEPRLSLAGTYDARWQRQRAPLWPEDFKMRFFHAAHPNLCSANPLRGDETVLLEGFAHEGPSRFHLPGHQPRSSAFFGEKRESQNMVLDGLYFDTEAGLLQMVWRASFPIRDRVYQVQKVQYRLCEPWETAA